MMHRIQMHRILMQRILRQAVACIALTLISVARTGAQASEAESVVQMAVVKELFDAMRAGDSARVRAVFHPQMVSLMSSDVGPDGAGRVRLTPVEAFIKTVGTPHAEVYDERLFNPRVLIDGSLASVWVDYSFFIGARLSHCGVDVIHVAKVGEAWKIIALSDTRRSTGCQR
jgi:Putative lumazine-binding